MPKTITFTKADHPGNWPFSDADTVVVSDIRGSLVATINGADYAMNGLANMVLHLPFVSIVEGTSVGEFIKEAKRRLL